MRDTLFVASLVALSVATAEDAPIVAQNVVREVCVTAWSSAASPRGGSAEQLLEPAASGWQPSGSTGEWVRFEVRSAAPIASIAVHAWGDARNPRAMQLREAPLSAAVGLELAEASVVASWEMAEGARLYTVILTPPIEPPSSAGGTVWWLEILSSWGPPGAERVELRDVQFTSTERQVLSSSKSFWAQVDVERPTRAPTTTPRTAAPTTSAYHTACLLWNNCVPWATEKHHRRALGDAVAGDEAGAELVAEDDSAGWRVPLVEKWSAIPAADGAPRVIHNEGVWVKADVLAEQAPAATSGDSPKASGDIIAPRVASEQLVCEGWAPRVDAASGTQRAWQEVCETDKAFCQIYNPCCDRNLHCLYVHYEGSHSCDWDEWIPADSPLVTFSPPPQYWSAPALGWDSASTNAEFLDDSDAATPLVNASIVALTFSSQIVGGEAAWLNEPPTIDPSSTAETRAFNTERWETEPDANRLQWVVLAITSKSEDGRANSNFNVTAVTVGLPGDVAVPREPGVTVGNPGRCWLQAADVAAAIVWDDVARIDISAPGQRSATVRIPPHGRRSAFWRLVLERPVLPHFAGAAPHALAVQSVTFSGHAVGAERDDAAPLDELIIGAEVVGFSSERDSGLHATVNLVLPDGASAALWAVGGGTVGTSTSPQWQSAALERRRRRLTGGGIAYAPQFTGTTVVDEFVILRVATDATDATALPRVARIDILLWSSVMWEGPAFGFVGPPMHCTASASSHTTLASATTDGAEWTRLGSFAVDLGAEHVYYAPPPLANDGGAPRARFVKLRCERMRMIANGEAVWTGEGTQSALPTFVNGIAIRRVRLVTASR